MLQDIELSLKDPYIECAQMARTIGFAFKWRHIVLVLKWCDIVCARSNDAILDARSVNAILAARSDSAILDARSDNVILDARSDNAILDSRSDNAGAQYISVVECRTRNRESPGSNPLCYRFEDWAFFVLFTVAPVDSAV